MGEIFTDWNLGIVKYDRPRFLYPICKSHAYWVDYQNAITAAGRMQVEKSTLVEVYNECLKCQKGLPLANLNQDKSTLIIRHSYHINK